MTIARCAGLVAAAVVICSSAAAAQPPGPGTGGGGGGGRAGGGQARVQDSAQRARLEGELRRGFARAVRTAVGLTDEQMIRLAPISRKYEQERRRLQMDERAARLALRDLIRDDAPADSAKVSHQLNALVELQRRRAALLEEEQRELAAIMSPVQRARYMALQEQLRRRMLQMRQRARP